MQIVGEHARAVLREGRVVSVWARTSQAIFLGAEDEVLWVSPHPVLHRRALVVTRLPHWPEGTVLTVREGSLVNGGRESLCFQAAARWSPPVLPQPPQDLATRAAKLGPRFFALCGRVKEWLGASKVQRVQEALRVKDGVDLMEAARDLVGTGPGLTPLGDDFLGGVLFALHVARQDWFSREWPKLRAWAQGRTTSLSLCLLSDLSQGHGPDPLHALASALFLGAVEELPHAAHRLLRVGHNTGAGLLCGALLAWSALV
ncbi:MAG: DUF2877 domain-containing protein [Candidatus Bipolaricaulaceae bacterium]